MVSVFLDSCYHIDLCWNVHFSDQLVYNYFIFMIFLHSIKEGWGIMIDSCALLVFSTVQTLAQMPKAQDGSTHIPDIFLYSRRKWWHIIHLCLSPFTSVCHTNMWQTDLTKINTKSEDSDPRSGFQATLSFAG